MNEIILTNLTTETLAEMAAEKAALVEQHGRKTVQAAIDCGRYLTEIKGRLGHGEWLPWLEQNWPQSQSRAHQYMKLANYDNCTNLDLGQCANVHSALKLIGEAEEAAGTKRTRKPADPAPEIIDNRKESRTIAQPKPTPDVEKHEQSEPQPANQSRGIAHDLPPEEPAALPRTNTHHSPATRQQIDRGSEPAPARPWSVGDGHTQPIPADLEDGAWYVYRSSKEPAFRLLSKEEILEAAIAASTTPQVLEALAEGYEGDQKKRVARQMREAADKLDPPEETKAPTLPQMRSIIADRAKLPPSDDRHLRPPVATAASEWAAHKSAMPKAKRYQSRTSWEACLTRMATMTFERGAEVVCDMIQRAIASGYQGWEFDTTNGRNGRSSSVTAIRTGRNFEAEMGPAINLADVEEF